MHDFMKSTASEDTKNKFIKIIKEHIISSKDINVVNILREIESFESEIIESLKNGEKKYLIPSSVKELEAYSDPLKMQGVRAVISWNYIYPDLELELPTKVDLVKLTLTEESELNKLKHQYPDMYEIIDKKAQGYELTTEEIEFFITEYTADRIPDYQASALLMAIRDWQLLLYLEILKRFLIGLYLLLIMTQSHVMFYLNFIVF